MKVSWQLLKYVHTCHSSRWQYFSPCKLVRKRGNALSKIIRHGVNLSSLPSLANEQKAELKVLSRMPDSEIDYSDIAPLDEAFWKGAVQNPVFRPTKTSTTVRVDSDALGWITIVSAQAFEQFGARLDMPPNPNDRLRKTMLTSEPWGRWTEPADGDPG